MNFSGAADWSSMCALVLMLGCRHGFDADHLATIDGLTRYHSQGRPRLSRYCGTLFSLGHGGVVLAIALGVSLAAHAGGLPHWLEDFGTAVSVFFLVLLGILNLRALWKTPTHEAVRLSGLKGRWLGPLGQPASPWLVALIGALFAISFDTLSQAALFAAVATRFGGWEHALVLGLLFVLGMLLVDGLNGLWVFRLLRRTDRMGVRASRLMGWAVSLLSFLVAALTLARWVTP